MADIVVDCAKTPDMPQFPCIGEKYGYPVMAFIQHPKGELTVAGTLPTVAEMQTGISASGQDKVIVIEEFTNGVLEISETQEESGADTFDGGTDVFGVNRSLNGNIKKMDENARAAFAKVSANLKRCNLWFVTNTGWLFGAKTGYKSSCWINPIQMGGFGSQPVHDFAFVHAYDPLKTDPATKDVGFLDLENVASS